MPYHKAVIISAKAVIIRSYKLDIGLAYCTKHCPAAVPAAQMVLNTSPDVGDLREVMNYIYEDIYVEYVVRNPLYVPGQPFK